MIIGEMIVGEMNASPVYLRETYRPLNNNTNTTTISLVSITQAQFFLYLKNSLQVWNSIPRTVNTQVQNMTCLPVVGIRVKRKPQRLETNSISYLFTNIFVC